MLILSRHPSTPASTSRRAACRTSGLKEDASGNDWSGLLDTSEIGRNSLAVGEIVTAYTPMSPVNPEVGGVCAEASCGVAAMSSREAAIDSEAAQWLRRGGLPGEVYGARGCEPE